MTFNGGRKRKDPSCKVNGEVQDNEGESEKDIRGPDAARWDHIDVGECCHGESTGELMVEPEGHLDRPEPGIDVVDPWLCFEKVEGRPCIEADSLPSLFDNLCQRLLLALQGDRLSNV